MNSFHRHLTSPKITPSTLDELFLVAQEIRELEHHYRDNLIYIVFFMRDMLEKMRSKADDKTYPAVCSQEFVESLKFIER
jgi:hypothetical protein